MKIRNWISKNLIELNESEEDKQKVPAATPKTQKQSVPVSQPPPASATAAFAPVHSPVTNTEIESARKHFAEVIAAKNMAGNDYYEFVLIKNAMQSVALEAERYKVAFLGLSAGGLNKDTLVSSASFYKNIIAEELTSFGKDYEQIFNAEVEDKRKLIETRKQQLQSLNDQIAKISGEIQQLLDESHAKETELMLSKNAFERAGSEAMGIIDDELGKINQYIN